MNHIKTNLRLTTGLLVLSLILVLLPSTNATTSVQTPTLNQDFMGMVIRDPWYDFGTHPNYPNRPNYIAQDQMGRILSEAGVRWVRLDFHIPVVPGIENEAALVEQEIAKNDFFITDVAPRYGFKVLALLNFSLIPTETQQLNEGPFNVPSEYGGGVNAYMDTWLTRALTIADRYRGSIDAYEILNEHNRLPPNGDAIDPTIAARLHTKFYRFCKNINPTDQNHGCAEETPIIIGGLHPRGTSDEEGEIVMTDAEYLRAMYTDTSSFVAFENSYGYYPTDGIGYHPYPEEIRLSPNNKLIDRGADRMRRELETVGDPCVPFWVTEVGYNVGFDFDGPKGSQPPQTEAGQMSFLRDVYTSLAARQICNGQPEVTRVFWFKYEDFPPADGANAQRWGIVTIPFVEDSQCPGGACYEPNGTPSSRRATFLMYRELAGLPVHHTFLPLANR